MHVHYFLKFFAEIINWGYEKEKNIDKFLIIFKTRFFAKNKNFMVLTIFDKHNE